MISPKADRAMIEWSVRLMLRRYGPENAATSDVQKYSLVQQAFRTLAEPSKRTEYDKEHALQSESTAPVAAPDNSKNGLAPVANPLALLKPALLRSSVTREHVVSQIQMRQSVVSVLYDAMIHRPRDPELGRSEVSRGLGRGNDELEFPLWFLREQQLIRTTPNGAYSITAKGALWAEGGGVPNLSVDELDESGGAQNHRDGTKSEMPLPKDTVNRRIAKIA